MLNNVLQGAVLECPASAGAMLLVGDIENEIVKILFQLPTFTRMLLFMVDTHDANGDR